MMKKFTSTLLVLTIFLSTVNVSFATGIEQGELYSYDVDSMGNAMGWDAVIEDDNSFVEINCAGDGFDESAIPNKEQFVKNRYDGTELMSIEQGNISSTTYSSTGYTFDASLLTKFNTITAPTIGNGANEPKFSYNSFLEENISDYSGELTLNFEDLVLDGRNGLNLRIGRTYQSVASAIGEKTLMILPDANGNLGNKLINNYSTYLLDRYNLGMGWGFSFPSIQIETEYIPEETVTTYYYEEESELYYHSGNGEVYQIEFTDDTTDSNLKGYYNKDIQFNKNDTSYSNGQVLSYYSMTLADKTKQYFAEDGRLIGIVDRFGNTIKFEHELSVINNRVPDGYFRYDDDMWITSTSSTGSYDAIISEKSDIGSDDGCVMYFRRNNEDGDSYIMSQPIQVKPLTDYELGIRIKSQYGRDVKVEIMGYDTAYNHRKTHTYTIADYTTEDWHDFTQSFSTSSAMRYIVIKITPEYAKYTYVDGVTLDEPKPLLKKITDSIGRTITFDYTGDLSLGGLATGNVTLTIKTPDEANTRTLTYTKEVIEFATEYIGHDEQRLFWYLNSSNTEGEDGVTVRYEYVGGATENEDGIFEFPKLYMKHNSKTHSDADMWINKPVLSGVLYKDRKKVYEYETVRKHFGDDGYYDTLRIKKKYDMYSYVPDGSDKRQFKGEVGAINYSYEGMYNGNSFDNESGYPNYTFDDETNLNEKWTVTKTGKTTDTVTFSNCKVVERMSEANGVTAKFEFTNHSTFENSPVQIKKTITQNGNSKNTYVLYTYNDWGGVETETREIGEDVKNDAELLGLYTTAYQYNPTYRFVTQKSYYNNIDMDQVYETWSYDALGRLTASENAIGKKTDYRYEDPTLPYLITSISADDPMGFDNVIGEDQIIACTYDSYGLYATLISESYADGVAETRYTYDYITGDVLLEIMPDNSQKQYTYYSDGKAEYVYLPYTQYLDGRLFYTIEHHTYYTNVQCENYTDEIPTYDVDKTSYYIVFTDEQVAKLYGMSLDFYDAAGNLKMTYNYDLSKTDESGNYISYNTKYYHDSYDRLIKVVDAEENTQIYTYDGFDRPVAITDCEGNVYNYAYDMVENKVDLTLSGVSNSTEQNLLTQYFNEYGNVVKNICYPNNVLSEKLTEQYEYDLNNNLISYTDAKGNETTYKYDALNRLTETILPDGTKATSGYSIFNEPTFEKIYDASGAEKSSRITYRNEKGDLSMKLFGYDKMLIDSNGYVADEKGRTTAIREGEIEKTVTYDDSDNLIVLTSGDNQLHRRYSVFGEVSSADVAGNIPVLRYGYDVMGNLAGKLQNDVYYMTYAYSSVGNITQSTMPSARTESYTYTANGNLDTIVSDGNTFDYDYYDTGYIKSLTYPNGLETSYEYDNINRVTRVTTTKNGTTINTFEYEYDNNGNTIEETRNGAITSYSYDSLDRLIEVEYSDGSSVAYEYDALNNRTKETYSNGDVKDYVYNEKHQLSEVKLNGEVTDTYTYNAMGAVATHNDKTFTYDEWDRLSGYSDGTDTYTYKYDANGIRTQKGDKQYIVDINNNVVAETDSTGAITDEILWGHQPLARKTNGSWYYYIYNAHGDVVGLVNNAGTVVNTYEYTPWGEIRSETETVDNPIKYAGEYYDEELDMIYLRARYYNPKIGRFTSLDIEEGEISNPLDMNRYVYCRNNPIKYVDPSGEGVILTCIIVGAVLGGIIGGITAAQLSKSKLGYVDGNWVLTGATAGILVGGLAGWGVGEAIAAIGATATVGSTGTLGNIIYSSWQNAENALRTTINGVSQTFSTPFGNRIIDAYNSSKGVIAEAKYGYASLTQFVQNQILKDAYLLEQGLVKGVEWHFYLSEATGKGGPSGPLLQELLDQGFKVIFH